MTARATGFDHAAVGHALLTELDWAAAEDAHERFRRLLDEMARAKAR